ncbi:flagellar biosynthetic protein FliO [Bacterioplanes sanyensis]|uniref:Flagellar protein n=1 Tax=Bacterioplanes sanyensis TaxID=1249553 RepID=A0A222FP64_9GAMM|nr:flagellar biosynthetic protein FliO [Bacterioplanes sanyensis]
MAVASDGSPAAPDPWASAGQVAMFLLLTIGLIFLLAWLATKAKAIRPMGGSQVIRPVATLALGVKEKVALVQVGEKQILLGITAQQITPLAEFDEPIIVADETSPTFAEVLKKAVRS